jgi:chloramphenicol 3-O-phosphotransferase
VPAETVPVLLVTGPVGAGKTTIAGEVSALLNHAGVPHAVVDMDALRWCYPSPPDDPYNEALARRNLAAIWPNFRAAGAGRLVLAEVLESPEGLGAYGAAIPGAEIVVVRLRASVPTLAARVTRRETGSGRDWHLARAAELAVQLERDGIGDVVVDTDGRSVGDVAREVLTRCGWPGTDGHPGDRYSIGQKC